MNEELDELCQMLSRVLDGVNDSLTKGEKLNDNVAFQCGWYKGSLVSVKGMLEEVMNKQKEMFDKLLEDMAEDLGGN